MLFTLLILPPTYFVNFLPLIFFNSFNPTTKNEKKYVKNKNKYVNSTIQLSACFAAVRLGTHHRQAQYLPKSTAVHQHLSFLIGPSTFEINFSRKHNIYHLLPKIPTKSASTLLTWPYPPHDTALISSNRQGHSSHFKFGSTTPEIEHECRT